MERQYQYLLLVAVMVVLGAGLVTPVVGADDSAAAENSTVTIDSALEDVTDEQTVIVRLSERPEREMQATSQDDQPEALKAHAEDTQTAFEQYADGNPHIEIEEQFWITNAILVTVDVNEVPLEELGTVEYVEEIHEDAKVEATHATGVQTSSPSVQPAVSADSTDSYTWGLENIGVPETWDAFDNRGDGISVAVLDSGVDGDHPDIDVAKWKDFDSNPSDDPKDYGDHGTHVSGTVVGGDASGEYIGVAPDAELYHGAVLTLNDGRQGQVSTIISGIEWAVDNDADVVSLSLGSEGYNTDYIDPIRNARQSGTIPVAASGNDGEGTSGSPGNVYDSIAVGATGDFSGEYVAEFSSGEMVDTSSAWGTAAPNDWPTEYHVPDVSAPGVDIDSAEPGGGYYNSQGTSMAAPHVSGTIALMLSNSDGEMTPDEVQDKLESTAVDIGEDKTRQGEGRIDAYEATIAAAPVFAKLDGPETAEVGIDEVTFDASESLNDNDIDRYEWSFSDGRTTETDSPEINHTFSDIGEQSATVTVVDDQGNDHTTSVEVDVIDETPPNPKITTPDTVAAESAAEFSAANSTDNHEIDEFEWELGDGTTATGTNITHTYSETGSKTIELTATDKSGNTNSTSTDITVGQYSTVSVTDPADGDYLPDSNVTISYDLFETDSDGAAGVEYRIESSSGDSVVEWTDAPFEETEHGSFSVENDTGSDGEYTVEFRIVDSDGEPLEFVSATDSATFTVKTTPPELTLDVATTAEEFDQFGPNNPAQINASVTDEINETATLWVADSDETVVSEWDLSEATGNGTVVTESWDATDNGETVESGEYDIGLTAEDSIGNTNETTQTVTVDTDEPSTSISEIDGGFDHEGAVYANESTVLNVTVDAEDGNERADGLYDVSLEAASETANYRVRPDLEADAEDRMVQTGEIVASDVEDDGPYTLSATVTDRANNTASSTDHSLVFDYTSPQVSTVITDVDMEQETAELRVRSSESLAEEPSVTVEQPSGEEISPSLDEESDERWSGTFELVEGGTYKLSASGLDHAGNTDTDTATTTVESVSTDNRTTTVYSESSGMFIRFNTTEEVEDRTVSMTEANISSEELTSEQFGVQFLTGELDDVLSAELENATIGIPTDSGALPGSVEPDDEQVEIEYYDEDDGWQSQATTIQTVDEADAVSGEYWTTTVESFSTYGVTVEDTELPSVTDTTATLSEDEKTVTLRAEYEDEISGINRSAVRMLVDKGADQEEVEVTDSDSTSITSSSATYEMEYDGDDEYRFLLELEDYAGNNNNEQSELYEAIVSLDDDDDNGGNGGGGGGGGGPTESYSDVRLSSFPSPSVSPDSVETGESVTVSGTFENRGTVSAQETISVLADGEAVASTTPRIGAGNSREIQLTFSFDDPGEYELSLESSSIGTEPVGEIEVTGEPIGEAAEDLEEDQEPAEQSDDTDVEVPGFGLLAAVVALVAGSLLARRVR